MEVIDLERVRAFVDRLDDLRGILPVDKAMIADVNQRWMSLSASEQEAAFQLISTWPCADLVHLRDVLLS